MKIASFALSDIGRVRRENQDTSGSFPRHNLFVVADGMGGHKGGKQASELAVATIEERLRGIDERADLSSAVANLLEAIGDANSRIVQRGAESEALRRMGTTLVALVLDGGAEGAVVHVGDSRVYRHRETGLELLTLDHTVVSDLVRGHEITAAEASTHPYRHVLTRALGADDEVSPDVRRIDVRAGDVYVICSDGVSGMLEAADIESIVSSRRNDPEAVCRELIAAANRAGGKDNATAIVVRCG